MIQSILDNDFYKFTMQNAVIKHFPTAVVEYEFINRGKHEFPDGFGEKLKVLVGKMSALSLKQEEYDFLHRKCPYLDPTYLDFLNGYQYNPNEVSITQKGSDLSVVITGAWFRTILWETPLMALICELYYIETNQARDNNKKVAARAADKMKFYRDRELKIAEFGTRRRHSYAVHDLVVQLLIEHGGGYFSGTSNVHLAQKYDISPIGTHAHEWFMFHAAKYGFKMANYEALENWIDVYRGDLGIALSDTYTSEIFYESFDKKFSKLFDGVRQDSGDPLRFVDITVAHYRSMGINPLDKTIIFSDGLNPEEVARIAEYAHGKIQFSFGIGTNFTNDVGLKKMNIVIKLFQAQPTPGHWIDTIKLSDEKFKHSGDEEMIRLASKILSKQFEYDILSEE